MQDSELLMLLVIANGAPIGARLMFGENFSWPVDFGRNGFDGRRIFGDSKTWRGIFAAAFIVTICAAIAGQPWWFGLALACLAMAGDLFSSFVKRRMGMPSSSMALGLDQIPESLLPLAILAPSLGLEWWRVLYLVLLFVIIELVLSRILFKFKIRKQPY